MATPAALPLGAVPRREAFREAAELTLVLARKTFQVRYKRATIGVIWAVLQPGFQGAVLAIVFSKVISVGKAPHYAEYVLTGIFAWNFFAQALSAGTVSVLDNESLVKKVALPKVIFPLSSIISIAMASAAALPVLVVASITSHQISWRIVLLPVGMLLVGGLVTGISLITGSLYVAYRDIRYVIESALLVGLYVTPVVYSLSQVGHTLHTILECNPMTGALEFYRWCILGSHIEARPMLITLGTTLSLTVVGLIIFNRRSDEFPDLL